MPRPNQTALALAIAATLNPQWAIAQTQQVYKLDKVLVEATRSERTIADTAATVDIIESEQLSADLVKDMNRVFDYTPGVSIETDPRFGVQNVNIRGLQDNRVKIAVDGVTQPQRFDSGAEFVQSGRLDIDPEMIKVVQVVKGPASSLHGSDAIAGLVNFQTKDPSDFLAAGGDDSAAKIKFGYYSTDKSFAQTLSAANRSGNLESLAIYTHRDGEQQDNFGSPDNQNNEKNNLLIKLQYQLNEQHRFGLSGEYVRTDTDTKLPLSTVSRGRPINYDYYQGSDNKTRQRITLDHRWDAQLAAFDQLTWSLSWQDKKEQDVTYRQASGGVGEKKDYLFTEQGYQFSLQATKAIALAGNNHQLVYGASANDNDISNINWTYKNDGSSTLYHYMPEASESEWGVFIQDEISLLNDRLLLTPGLRYDSFSTKPDNTVPTNGNTNGSVSGYEPVIFEDYQDSAHTARLGAVYTLNQTHKVFAQYSQGFRAPDFKELYYSFTNTTHRYRSAPNPNLEAEQSDSFELGLRSKFKSAETEIAIFYSDFDNFIETITGTDDLGISVTTYDNLEQAEIKGIEFSGAFWLDQWIDAPTGTTLRLSAAYTEGEDKQGQPLNSVNPWNIVLGLGYDAPSGLWGGELKTVYTDGKDKSDINRQLSPGQIATDSATVVDLTAYYKPLPSLTLRAGVFNLTNDEHIRWNDARGLTENNVRPLQDYTQPERNYSVSLSYAF